MLNVKITHQQDNAIKGETLAKLIKKHPMFEIMDYHFKFYLLLVKLA